MRKLLSLGLSAVLASLSVEPAFSQVRVIAVESAVVPVGQVFLPVGISDRGGFQPSAPRKLTSLAPALGAAPSAYAASVPSPAAAARAAASDAMALPVAAAAASVPEAARVGPLQESNLGKSFAAEESGAGLETSISRASVEQVRAEAGRMFGDGATSGGTAAPQMLSGVRGALSRLSTAGSLYPADLSSRGRRSVLPLLLAAAAILGPLSPAVYASGFKGFANSVGSSSLMVLSTAVPLVAVAVWSTARFAYYRSYIILITLITNVIKGGPISK